jgi:hypothetical protein
MVCYLVCFQVDLRSVDLFPKEIFADGVGHGLNPNSMVVETRPHLQKNGHLD